MEQRLMEEISGALLFKHLIYRWTLVALAAFAVGESGMPAWGALVVGYVIGIVFSSIKPDLTKEKK